MLVKEIMTPSMDAVGPDLTLKETARKMRDFNVGSLPVWEKGELLGMITDRDICCRAVAEGRDPARTTVREVMSREVTSCFSDDDIAEAAQLMEAHKISGLLVVDDDSRVVGALNIHDLLRARVV